jgi:hypothetical protein
MIPEFSDLTHAEIELMHKAPIWVSILIAGADDKIDKNEVRRAIELTSKNLKASNSRLLPFYDEVGEDFEDKLRIVLQELPRKEKERSKVIIDQLAKLNDIFKRVNRDFNIHFYKSLKEIALEVAQSSGGVLGMSKVGEKEARYLSLDMIKDPAAS